jgi:ubiquinone biosynthesis UbiH/UbiF/VisC/COQ6 family hydroxylase
VAIAEPGGDHGVPHHDVLIAGAGLVGLSLAAALAAAGRSVALADRALVTSPPAATGDDDWDARVYAISPGSVAFLSSIGAWQALPADRIAPIEAMAVEGDGGARLHFSAYELGERALAWIVEERTLKSALVGRVATAGVALHAPCAFDSLAFSPKACVLHCGADMLRARLVVGADGLRSSVREMAGIVAATKPYGQTAVVANFNCERPHLGRAFQWFHDDGGVLAWLPLPGRRVSMVWSAPHALADELLALPADALAARVAARGRHCLGAFETITPAASFPLQLSTLPTTVAHRVALVGDAAHGIHPLAGQGVNLGFGDAEALAAVLRDSGPVTDPGEPLLLERFARQRKAPVLAMQYVTDGLARLFRTSLPLVRTARNWGMTAVDRLPPAKRVLAQSALR